MDDVKVLRLYWLDTSSILTWIELEIGVEIKVLQNIWLDKFIFAPELRLIRSDLVLTDRRVCQCRIILSYSK